MIVKCMSDENTPDDDSRKTYRLLSEVKGVEFVRQVCEGSRDGAVVCMNMKDGSFHEEHCYGNVYVMNDAGKTVSSFGIARPPAPQNDCPVPAP